MANNRPTYNELMNLLFEAYLKLQPVMKHIQPIFIEQMNRNMERNLTPKQRREFRKRLAEQEEEDRQKQFQ